MNPSAHSQGANPGGYDALIIVPPFCELHYPSLGAHVMQACGRAAGFKVRVFYANIHFAATIGCAIYTRASRVLRGTFAGERLFARAAYGAPPLGRHADDMFGLERIFGSELGTAVYADFAQSASALLEQLKAIEQRVPGWVDAIGEHIARVGIRIIGATSTFEQTAPAISLLGALKTHNPDAITIMGGANCEGEMAQGILALAPFLDHVFSGESEQTFPAFLSSVTRGDRPKGRIITGHPCRDLDTIPLLDYDDYFEQRAEFLSRRDEAALEETSLPYETSRGCWWGEKHHCTFCGLNGEGMAFRTRSVDRSIDELRSLTERYNVRKVMMADNIMPYRFFSTLVPRLAAELSGLNVFYEQKANLTRARLISLKAAGIEMIQPGIEALSTGLLQLMDKGVSAAQNINLLRDARGLDISLVWNLLWGFPGDQRTHYEETLSLFPFLRHLQPPGGFWPVMIDRFCPYFDHPEKSGVTNIRPLPGYFDVLPADAPVSKIAYHFKADFDCESYRARELLREVQGGVDLWRASWTSGRPPELRIGEHKGTFILVDTRELPDTESFELLDPEQISQLIAAQPYDGGPNQRGLIARKLALRLDAWFVPLAVIDQRTLKLVQEALATELAPAAPQELHASSQAL
jgi:ribosomal peptide maturation radical SAM protein 1